MSAAASRRQFLAAVAAIAAIAAALAPGPAARAAPTPEATLRIGVSLSTSGHLAAFGEMQAKGYRLWERDVNAQGGILGRKVEVDIRDDGSSADKARALYTELIERDRVHFVFGPYSSGITMAVAAVTEQHGYPLLSSGGTSDEIWQQGFRSVFGIAPTASRFSVGFLALLAEAKVKSVAVVATDDTFGRHAAEGARVWAGRYGLQIATVTIVRRSDPQLQRAVDIARRSGAEALLLAGYLDEAVTVRKILKRIDWSPVGFYATPGGAVPQYQERLGPDADTTFSTSLWEPRADLRYPGAPEFFAHFQEVYGTVPSYHAAQTYAAGRVLEQAIQRAGSFDRDKVREALRRLDAHTIVGRYAVDRNGVQAKQLPLIIQWQAGRREIVWPPEMATAPPAFKPPGER
jgi:branched-chain amino acid transport system substrate-binding protein